MEQGKKKRAQNWTPEEKEILRLLIAEKAEIIENKCNTTSSTVKKNQEWKNIANRFNEMIPGTRSDGEIKLAWKRMKLAAKANLSAHRIQVQRTGGGQKPPSPSVEDMQIMAIAPQDFVINISDYDSDRLIDTNEPVAGPSQASEPYYVQCHVVAEEDSQKNKIQQDTPVIQPATADQEHGKTNDSSKKKGKGKKSKQRTPEDFKQAILDGNISFKKKQVEMLEEAHEYNIKIAKLKIRKLELEIALLEEEEKKRNKE